MHLIAQGQHQAGISTPSAWRAIDRDGTIYKTFEDSLWIYHLGLTGTNNRFDKQSVATEFANEGPLELDGDRLYAFPKSRIVKIASLGGAALHRL